MKSNMSILVLLLAASCADAARFAKAPAAADPGAGRPASRRALSEEAGRLADALQQQLDHVNTLNECAPAPFSKSSAASSRGVSK
jgi:hypothetical protein